MPGIVPVLVQHKYAVIHTDPLKLLTSLLEGYCCQLCGNGAGACNHQAEPNSSSQCQQGLMPAHCHTLIEHTQCIMVLAVEWPHKTAAEQHTVGNSRQKTRVDLLTESNIASACIEVVEIAGPSIPLHPALFSNIERLTPRQLLLHTDFLHSRVLRVIITIF